MNQTVKYLYEELLINECRVVKCEPYLSNGAIVTIEDESCGNIEEHKYILGPRNIEHDLMILYRHVFVHKRSIVECIKKDNHYEVILSRGPWLSGQVLGEKPFFEDKIIELRARDE